MNKNKYILLLLFALSLSMIVGSCKKKKPPVGIYVGIFSYKYPSTWGDKFIVYKITDTNKDYFLIGISDYQGNFVYNQDTVYKDKKKEVHGRVPAYGRGPYEIKGKWSHKLFSKEYTIEGDFTQTDYTHGGVFTYSGTFVIKSDY